jgi:rhodanese-related sulfurtransferase
MTNLELQRLVWNIQTGHLNQIEKTVLIRLCYSANDCQIAFKQSMAVIAVECQLGMRAVMAAVESMKLKGVLDVFKDPGVRGGGNAYLIKVDVIKKLGEKTRFQEGWSED